MREKRQNMPAPSTGKMMDSTMRSIMRSTRGPRRESGRKRSANQPSIQSKAIASSRNVSPAM